MTTGTSRGYRLFDLIAVVAVLALLFSLGIPTLAHPRNVSKRDRCADNLRAISTASKIYANDNSERWMIPAFKADLVDNGGIDYLAGDWINTPPLDPGEVGYDRENESHSPTAAYPNGGSTSVSVTRAYWMLVRSGDLGADDFICPTSHDRADRTRVPEWYYDFAEYDNISYGYQVPFGPRETQPREGARNRQPMGADKGPYYLNTFEPTFQKRKRGPILVDDARGQWHRYNSPNHRGRGQNVMFADGSVFFEETSAVGIDGDNIYTLMTDEWDGTGFNIMHGESPHFATVAEFPYPGQDVFGMGEGMFSSTDTLIYP